MTQLNEKFPDVMMSVQKLPPKKPFGSLDASLIGSPSCLCRVQRQLEPRFRVYFIIYKIYIFYSLGFIYSLGCISSSVISIYP